MVKVRSRSGYSHWFQSLEGKRTECAKKASHSKNQTYKQKKKENQEESNLGIMYILCVSAVSIIVFLFDFRSLPFTSDAQVAFGISVLEASSGGFNVEISYVSNVEIAGFALQLVLANGLSPAPIIGAFGPVDSILQTTFLIETSDEVGSVLAFALSHKAIPVAPVPQCKESLRLQPRSLAPSIDKSQDEMKTLNSWKLTWFFPRSCCFRCSTYSVDHHIARPNGD